MSQLLYATSNQGKLSEVGGYLRDLGWEIIAPAQLGPVLDVSETGSTLEENALLKLAAYRAHYPDWAILSDDTGVEIDALHGEPGIYVRRWRDRQTDMTDEDVIAYALERLQGVPDGERGAQFRTVLAVQLPGQEPQLFDGVLRGQIVTEPIELHMAGFPFESIFYVDEAREMLGELHQRAAIDRVPEGLSHRERAVQKLVAWLEREL